MKTQLTSHQQEVFDKIIEDIKRNLFSFTKSENIEDYMISLTGAAGTGKSYLTAQIVKEIKNSLEDNSYFYNDNICVTAPTHKAVKVIREMLVNNEIESECLTIHSFLNLKPIYDYSTGAERFIIDRFAQKNPSASLLIVDESSMVSKELYRFIIEVIEKGFVNTALFIGDKYQLLPVKQGVSDVFNLKKQYELTQIVRQAEDNKIIQLSTKIRTCIANKIYPDLKEIFEEFKNSSEIEFFTDINQFSNDFHKRPNWYKEDKILTAYTNHNVDLFNEVIRLQFWEEHGNTAPDFFLSKDMVRFKKPYVSVKSFPVSSKVLYQNGEEVMIDKSELMHDEKYKFMFWKCSVVGRGEDEFFRVIDPDYLGEFNNLLNEYINYAKSEKEPYNRYWWKKYFELRDAFADIQYVYAATIHKLQGSTYDTVYIDVETLIKDKSISSDLLYRLLYVAVTRARKKIKIIL